MSSIGVARGSRHLFDLDCDARCSGRFAPRSIYALHVGGVCEVSASYLWVSAVQVPYCQAGLRWVMEECDITQKKKSHPGQGRDDMIPKLNKTGKVAESSWLDTGHSETSTLEPLFESTACQRFHCNGFHMSNWYCKYAQRLFNWGKASPDAPEVPDAPRQKLKKAEQEAGGCVAKTPSEDRLCDVTAINQTLFLRLSEEIWCLTAVLLDSQAPADTETRNKTHVWLKTAWSCCQIQVQSSNKWTYWGHTPEPRKANDSSAPVVWI